MKQALQHLLAGHQAKPDDVSAVMAKLMAGEADPIAVGSFLTLQARNGIDGSQLNAALEVMLSFARTIEIQDRDAIDNCGTGGDGGGGFNVSTTAAFAIAGAGFTVAKHGNRAVSSTCGSADLLEDLGIQLSLSPEQVRDCIDEVGIGFMFAPVFHPAVRYAVPIRKALKVRTMFNMLGPLANPAGVKRQLIGVFAPHLTDIFAQALAEAGKTAMVVHGLDGADEVSLSKPTKVAQVRQGHIETFEFDPQQHGFHLIPEGSLPGGSLEANRGVFEDILKHRKSGAAQDMVVLNAGFALFTSGKFTSLNAAFDAAREAIQSGAAWQKVEALKSWTKTAAEST